MTWPAIIILTAACVACAANAYTLVKLTIRLNAAERAMRTQLEVMAALVDRLGKQASPVTVAPVEPRPWWVDNTHTVTCDAGEVES